jgi:hypothetical protein
MVLLVQLLSSFFFGEIAEFVGGLDLGVRVRVGRKSRLFSKYIKQRSDF